MTSPTAPSSSVVLADEDFYSRAAPWFADDNDAIGFIEHRSAQPLLSIEEALGAAVEGGPTNSGNVIGPEAAMRIAAASACRRVIAEGVAKLPRRVVRVSRDATGRETTQALPDHPVHRLLNDGPNDWMTPFEFVEYMVGVSTFHRGAYALVQRDTQNRVAELLPLLPGTCEPITDSFWEVTYHVNGYGMSLQRAPGQIFRLHGSMADPWQGQSTVSLAREAVGLAAAIEASQARFHKNDLRPSGILTTEQTIAKDQRDEIQRSWQSAYGLGGQGGVAVLDKSFKFEGITAEGVKSEVIENRKFQISEICRFFGVFPTLIGHNDGSQSFASIEALFGAHKEYTLHPWVKRFEEAATLCLLSPEERARGLRVDLDMDAAARGTATDRFAQYEKATKTFMTPNEARIREGLAPLNDPDMDRVQLQRNNTGAFSSGADDSPVGSRPPAAGKPGTPGALPSPTKMLMT